MGPRYAPNIPSMAPSPQDNGAYNGGLQTGRGAQPGGAVIVKPPVASSYIVPPSELHGAQPALGARPHHRMDDGPGAPAQNFEPPLKRAHHGEADFKPPGAGGTEAGAGLPA